MLLNTTRLIDHQVYLPYSQVCCYQEPLPFHVTLFASDLALESFAEYRPMPSSFLPLSPTESRSSCETVQNQLTMAIPGLSRAQTQKHKQKCPVRIRVQRMTAVDANGAGFTFGSFYQRARHEAIRSFVKSDPGSAPTSTSTSTSTSTLTDVNRSYMHSAQSIGHGVVHSVNRGVGSVGWSGAIIIPPAGPGFTGGFEASGLQVVVSATVSAGMYLIVRLTQGRSSFHRMLSCCR